MIRDEDGALTGYVYIDLNSKDYGGFVKAANDLFREKLHCSQGTLTSGLENTNSSNGLKSVSK